MSEETKKINENEGEIILDKSKIRRARLKVWISAAVITAIMGAIGALIGSLLDPIFGVLYFGITVVVLMIVWLPGELVRVRRCFCSRCGEKYDYLNDVEWEVSDIEIKEKNTNPNKTTRQVEGIRIEHVDAECICRKCGETRNFHKKFRTGVLYDDGKVKAQNIQVIMKKYFKV